MCRGMNSCSELGVIPGDWSKEAPLPPPEWFNDELIIFNDAVYEASIGNLNHSIQLLQKIKSNAIREWYVEHGQMSGFFRDKILQTPKNDAQNINLDSLRSPDRHAKQVFERDHYKCCYCGIRVIPKNILKAFNKVVGDDVFKDTGTNAQRHGIVLAFRANADHVVPWNLGGQTTVDNLVTSCWSCNYGKSGYTLKELGLNNPREKIPYNDGWNGLSSLTAGLKEYAAYK